MLVYLLTNLWRLVKWSLLGAVLNVFLEHSWAWHSMNALVLDPRVQISLLSSPIAIGDGVLSGCFISSWRIVFSVGCSQCLVVVQGTMIL
ncbi:unnamed protein product [Prunus armeniaca]